MNDVELVASIDDQTGGRWIVDTESQARYVLDLDRREILRIPTETTMRRDIEPLPLLKVIKCSVGQEAMFLVKVRSDVVPTLRTTTHVTSIAFGRSTSTGPTGGS